MQYERFVIRAVPGGFATLPADPKACPLLERLYAGPVDESVSTDDTLSEFIARLRRVGKDHGLTVRVCGDLRHAPTVLLAEQPARCRSPKPRRGWINTLADVASRLFDLDPGTYDEHDDRAVRQLVERISHRAYKNTGCGAWVALITAGEWRAESGRAPARHPNGSLVGVSVGSIVEGIEATTDTHTLCFPFPAKRFWAALDAVEAEASALWNESHGCATCAAHWHAEGYAAGEYGPFEGDDGLTPVWPECPDCGGSGSII